MIQVRTKATVKSESLISDIQVSLNGSYSKNEAEFVFKLVLHSIRDHFTIDDSIKFLSNLPIFIKSVYLNGYKPSNAPEKYNGSKEFMVSVISHLLQEKSPHFENTNKTIENIRIVFQTLIKYIPENNLNCIKSLYPLNINYPYNFFE